MLQVQEAVALGLLQLIDLLLTQLETIQEARVYLLLLMVLYIFILAAEAQVRTTML
jgi:hypothetical protein